MTTTYDRMRAAADLLRRYRTETPLGHQPHMIAHLAEAAELSLRADADRLEETEKEMREAPHRECEDAWYSCPLSEEVCLDSRETACNCHVSTLTALADRIRGEAT